MSAGFDRLIDLVYPGKCIFCHRLMTDQPGMICPDCRKTLSPAPEITGRGEFYKRAVGTYAYSDLVRESILRFKFYGCSFYASVYGKEMADLIAEKLEGKYDLITFVPVSRLRRFSRGYDQSKLLAEAIGRELDQPVVRSVKKTKNTRRQSRLHSAAERKANIQNAFRAWHPENWAGKRLLLIDDVLTTGATVSEVSRVLLTNGAAEVSCCFLAVTPGKQSK